VGGANAISAATEEAIEKALGESVLRIAGADRYETARGVLDLRDDRFVDPARTMVFASGAAFPDGLAGVTLASAVNSGLLLTRPQALPEVVEEAVYERRHGITGVILLGGTGAISGAVGLRIVGSLSSGDITAPEAQPWVPKVTVRYSPSEDLSGPTLGRYYVDMSGNFASSQQRPRDAAGIVMVKYSDLPDPVYNPVTVAQYAIGSYDEYLISGSELAKRELIKHAEWLRDYGMDAEGRFAYRWNYSPRGLVAPWYSAMAQGEGISALLRAYQVTGHSSFIAAARRAFVPFTKTTKQGGVTTVSGADLWLEEYVEPNLKQVLNGHIFAAWGLWDLYRVTGDETARDLFERSCTTVLRNLDDYEYNGFVLYERAPAHYCHSYYWLQIRQLRILTGITGDMRYADRADVWALMDSDPASTWTFSSEAASSDPTWFAPGMADPLNGW